MSVNELPTLTEAVAVMRALVAYAETIREDEPTAKMSEMPQLLGQLAESVRKLQAVTK